MLLYLVDIDKASYGELNSGVYAANNEEELAELVIKNTKTSYSLSIIGTTEKYDTPQSVCLDFNSE